MESIISVCHRFQVQPVFPDPAEVAEIYFGMSVEQKRMVHLRLCEAAPAVWENSLSGQVTLH